MHIYRGSRFNDIQDIIIGEAIPFRPSDKFSPIVADVNAEWANGQDDVSRTIPTHDASAGAVPSYTTAKKGSFAIVTVAGTLGTKAVSKGDLLMAAKDNPTVATDWYPIRDCTSQFEDAVEAAGGGYLWLQGTYLLQNANPDAQIKLKGDFCILNRCGYPAINQTSNTTYATAATSNYQCSAVTKAIGNDPVSGTSLQQSTRFTLSTIGNATNFKTGQMIKCFTDKATPETAALSAKVYVAECFKVQLVDTVNGYVYADRVLQMHPEVAAATNIYLHILNDDRAMKIEGALLMGAPTIIGESVGWWRTLVGDEVSSTITGNSGSDRTISRTAHNLIANQYVIVGTSSGTLHTTCKVKSVTNANTFVITVPSTQDHSASSPSIGTSGTLYYAPAFVTSNFDSVTHGGSIQVLHANKSFIRYRVSKLWSSGVRPKFSNYCETYLEGSYNGNNPYTDNDNVSGRLRYDYENYSGSQNKFYGRGVGTGRHMHADSTPDTSSAWAATMWTSQGCNTGEWVELEEESADGGGADTHQGNFGARIISRCKYPCVLPVSASYKGFGGNLRGSNEWRTHEQIGGFEGLILRKYEQQAGAMHRIDLDVRDIPYASTSNLAFRAESMTGLTVAPTVIGEWKIKNCGVGFKCDTGLVTRLQSLYHWDIAKRGGYLLGTTDFDGGDVTLDFRQNTSGEATRYAIFMEDTATFRATTMKVILGSANNPTEIFTDNDNDSGKTVNVGVLIISDPSNVGMPALVTAGRESNFTLNIGQIIYNGKTITAPNMPGLKVGRYLVTPSFAAITSFTAATTDMYACPVFVNQRMTFSAVCFGVNGTATVLNVKVGIYKDNGGEPGDIVSGSTATGGAYTDAADTNHEVALSANLVLNPGWYWVAMQTDQNQSLKGLGTAAGPATLGAGNMIQAGPRVSKTNTYASGLPASFGTPTYTENVGMVYLGLKRAA